MNGAEDHEWWVKISGERPLPQWRIERDAHFRDLEAEYMDLHPAHEHYMPDEGDADIERPERQLQL